MQLTADFLTLAFAAVYSMAASYIPGFNTWYAGLKAEYQKLIMVGAIFLTTAIVFGLNCAGLFGAYIPAVACTYKGGEEAIVVFFLAIAVNQGVYKKSPQLPVVLEAKASRPEVIQAAKEADQTPKK